MLGLILLLQSVLAPVSLDSVLKKAALENPAVKAAFFKYRAEAEKVAGASALPEPMVMFRLFVEPRAEMNRYRGFEAGVQQQIPWPGVRKTAREGAELQSKLAFETLREITFKTGYEVRIAFFERLMERRMILLEEKQLQIMETMKTVANSRISSGKSSAAESILLEIKIDDMKNVMAIRRRNDRKMAAEMNALAGVENPPDSTLPAFPVEIPPPSLETLLEQAPRLTGTRYMELMAQNELAMAKLDAKPMLTATLGVMNAQPLGVPGMTADENRMWMPQLNVSVPLFSKKIKTQITAAGQSHESAAMERLNMHRMFQKDLEMALVDLENARAGFELAKIQADRSARVLAIRMQEYSSGAASFDMLSDALVLPLQFQSAQLTALFSWHITKAWLDYLTAQTL